MEGEPLSRARCAPFGNIAALGLSPRIPVLHSSRGPDLTVRQAPLRAQQIFALNVGHKNLFHRPNDLCVKDKNVMIKLAAERAALHVLQIKDGTPSAVRLI